MTETPPSAPPPASRDDAERREAEDILNSLLLYRHADGVDQSRRFFSGDAKRLADVLRVRDAALASAQQDIEDLKHDNGRLLQIASAEAHTVREANDEARRWRETHVETARELDAARAEIASLKEQLVAAECVLDDEEAGALDSVRLIQHQREEIARLRSAAPSGDLRAELTDTERAEAIAFIYGESAPPEPHLFTDEGARLRRHLTESEQRTMKRALLSSSKLIAEGEAASPSAEAVANAIIDAVIEKTVEAARGYIMRQLDAARQAGERAGREQMREEASRAAKGEDAERPVANEIAAAYIQGRLDARTDVRRLRLAPDTEK